MLALGAGARATFSSSNDLGTLGLQIVGAAFLFLGLSGLIPKRLTVGGNSVEYGDFAEDVVEGALKSSEPEVREAVARQVIETAGSRGPELQGTEDSREARRLMHRALAELQGNRTLEAVRRSLPLGSIEFDGLGGLRRIVFGRPDAPPSRCVAVTVMYAPLHQQWLKNYVHSTKKDRGHIGAHVYLGPGSTLPSIASVSPLMFTASWESPKDDAHLREVLAAALQAAETGDAPDRKWFADRGDLT